MGDWAVWTWPWEATLEMWRRALVAAAPDATAAAPEWTQPNREVLDLAALRLRDFSTNYGSFPALVVTPFALHDAQIADLAPGHSLIEALLREGCTNLRLVEWKSATESTRLHTIDAQLASLNVAVDDIGPPLDMIGLCQGGWLALVYAARFPSKVRRLVLAGAPIDIHAGPSALTEPLSALSHFFIDELDRRGDGRLLGRDMARLWPREADDEVRRLDALQIREYAARPEQVAAVEAFRRWDVRAFDLPAPYYREVFEWLYRENRLARGAFTALGHVIDLRALACPIYLLAGERDVIAPPAQALAAARLVGAREADIETATAPCGHLSLFMGRETLTREWPCVARWLLA